MSGAIKVETCPQCGAPVRLSSNKCAYCQSEFIVTSLGYLDRFEKPGISKYVSHYRKMLNANPADGESNCAMGICHLNLGLYDLAIDYFAKAIDHAPHRSEAYYYYALALLKGRRPKLLTLTEIRKIESNLAAAIQLDDTRCQYYYLWALVKDDFYLKNGLRVNPPTFEELIHQGDERQYDKPEVENMLRRVPTGDSFLIDILRR